MAEGALGAKTKCARGFRLLWRCGVVLVLVAAGCVAAAAGDTPTTPWQPINPGGGGWFERVTVGTDGTIIACSDLSGAYRSTDGGDTWDNVGFSRGLATTHTACAAIHPADPSIVLLGTDDGVYRSIDGAITFDAHVLVGGYVEHIAFDPQTPATVYAGWHPEYDAVDGEVYKSTDAGLHWAPAVGQIPAGRRIIKLVVADDPLHCVYVLTGTGRFATGPANVYRSSDGGASWFAVGDIFNDLVVDVAVDKTDPNTLYASVTDPNALAPGHLYKSTDRGESWTHLARRGGHIWLDADDPQTIRMIEPELQFPWLDDMHGIWESTAGGAEGSWVRVSGVDEWERGWSGAYWAFGATSAAGGFAEDPSDSAALYWVNAQFAYATFDKGRTVVQRYCVEADAPGSNRWRSRGLDNTVPIALAVSEADPNQVYAGFFDLGTMRSLDGGATWTPVNDPNATGGWEGAGGHTWSIVADPQIAGVVWATQAEDPNTPGTLLMSGDAGDTWLALGRGDLPAAPLLGLSLDPSSPAAGRILFLTGEGDVYRSRDGGFTWTRVLANGGLRFTAVDPLDARYVYAGGESGLWRSAAGGDPGSWTEIGLPEMHGTDGGVPFWGWEGVFDIRPDPVRPGWLYVVVVGPDRGLYRSYDHGTTWPAGEAPLLVNDFLRRVAIDPTDADILYVTSSSAFDSGGYESGSLGVLRSLDGGETWTPINEGLSWPFAMPIVLRPGDPGVVLIGAPGPGLHKRRCGAGWFANPDGDCDVDMADFGALVPCLRGPGVTPPGGNCDVFDADFDDDVDAGDFARMQRAFTQ